MLKITRRQLNYHLKNALGIVSIYIVIVSKH